MLVTCHVGQRRTHQTLYVGIAQKGLRGFFSTLQKHEFRVCLMQLFIWKIFSLWIPNGSTWLSVLTGSLKKKENHNPRAGRRWRQVGDQGHVSWSGGFASNVHIGIPVPGFAMLHSLVVLVPLPMGLCCGPPSPIPFSFSKVIKNSMD